MSAADRAARPASMMVRNFTTISAGALRGFFDVTSPSGMTLFRCSLFVKDGKAWAGPPSKQVITRDGTVKRGTDGKVIYEQTVGFIDRATETRWSDQVIEALRIAEPDALA